MKTADNGKQPVKKAFCLSKKLVPNIGQIDTNHVYIAENEWVTTDKKGKLVATGYGANDWSDEASVKFIEQLLSE